MDQISLIIDELALSGLPMATQNASQFKLILESELQRLIEREGLPQSVENTQIESVTDLHIESSDERQMARNIARQLISVLHGPN